MYIQIKQIFPSEIILIHKSKKQLQIILKSGKLTFVFISMDRLNIGISSKLMLYQCDKGSGASKGSLFFPVFFKISFQPTPS